MMTGELTQFLIGIPWFAWIAIVAIICGSITQALAQRQRHVERIEMIRQGMNPNDRKSSTPEI